jgi:hypothetical protein
MEGIPVQPESQNARNAGLLVFASTSARINKLRGDFYPDFGFVNRLRSAPLALQ